MDSLNGLDADDQLRILTDGAVDVLPHGDLERKVRACAAGERPPLRVKFGMDPTSPDLHIGHSVVLRKLRSFQDLGHTAVLVVGGYTAQVGDPSGRSTTRPRLTAAEVEANARTYLEQVSAILSDQRLEVTDNATWLASMDTSDVLRLSARSTVAQMLERADFSERYHAGRPIALNEFLYPLLQGQDSVAITADVELGGTDQTFNLLMGRQLQQAAGQEPQSVLTMPLLEGLDGSTKMSKTAGNTVGLTDPAEEAFGKLMRVPDGLMVKYFRLATDLHPDAVDAIAGDLQDGRAHPGATKRRLARTIVGLYHGTQAAEEAEARFDVIHVQRAAPDDVAQHALAGEGPWFLPTLLQESGLVPSGSEARRMVGQGAVRLDGQVLTDPTAELTAAELQDRVLQVGRRRQRRIIRG